MKIKKPNFAHRIPFYYGWVIVAVGFITMGVGLNARTTFSLLFPPILDEFGWSRGTVAAAFSVGFLGCFSTFSSFIYQLFLLLQKGQFIRLFYHYFEVIIISFICFYLGYCLIEIIK